jgi:hypothetical protein
MTGVSTPLIATLGNLAVTPVDKHHTRAQNECLDSGMQLDSELLSRVARLPERQSLAEGRAQTDHLSRQGLRRFL